MTGWRSIGVVVAAFMVLAGGSRAQEFPPDTITIVQGYAPGGSADAIARLVAEGLSEWLDTTVLVEPMPGAGGNIAAAAIAAAQPDGRTLGLVTGGHAVAQGLYHSLPFRPVEDFATISNVVDYSFVVAVLSEAPFRTLGDLAEAHIVSYASAGTGTTHHLLGELTAKAAGVEFNHIPYRGEGAAITALLSGEVDAIIASPATLRSHLDTGAIRALAVSSAERSPALPEVPTLAEAGVQGVAVTTWAGLVAPASLPQETVRRLNEEIAAVLRAPERRARIEAVVGGTVVMSTPEEMRERIAREAAFWVEVVEETGIERQ